MSTYRNQVSIISRDDMHAGTLRPRLDSAHDLAGSVITSLECRLRGIAGTNGILYADPPGLSEDALADERLIRQAVTALEYIRSKIRGIMTLSDIHAALAPAVPAVRILSSDLFEPAPECSQKLCELSACLGSIVMDSAVLTSARCDFGLSNAESGRLLDEAKLMADSKINKRYPNLETVKTDNT